MKVRVLVRPKRGILDPQGEAVRGALPALGFEGVRSVRVGRLIEMEVESDAEVEAMCRRLLANPTTEEYEWEVVG
ncbi:MAG: phosphoribosylformylglycinamidine synthase subunit PurS [Rubrobacter sp.]|nr:phosphoribosylformylglycinamidine synthase subunit PurS [Rubrobacter sp.]